MQTPHTLEQRVTKVDEALETATSGLEVALNALAQLEDHLKYQPRHGFDQVQAAKYEKEWGRLAQVNIHLYRSGTRLRKQLKETLK